MQIKIKFLVGTVLSVAMISGLGADDAHERDHGDEAERSMAMPQMPMHKRMQNMQMTMVQLHKADSVEERMRLMQAHMEQMHGFMGNMHGNGRDDGMMEMCSQHMQSMRGMHGLMEQMLAQMQAQQNEIKRLSDHAQSKR